MFGKCYVLSDTAHCWFSISQANFGEFQVPAATRPILAVLAATGY